MSPCYSGCMAFYAGIERSANPFVAGTFDFKQWLKGWDDEYYFTYGCYP